MQTHEMPKAVSDDAITADGGPVTQPVEVRRAVRLLWCSLAIAIVTMLINETVRRAEPHPPGLAPVFIGLSALIATFSAMVVGIARGRNWVRLLMLFVVAWFAPAIGFPCQFGAQRNTSFNVFCKAQRFILRFRGMRSRGIGGIVPNQKVRAIARIYKRGPIISVTR